MKRGQKPTPKALRVLRGNPSKRPISRSEPDGVGDMWSPPSYFDAAQKREWTRVVESAPWLTGTDRDLLASFCVAVVEYARAVVKVRKSSQTTVTKHGNEIVAPHLGIMNRQALLMNKFGAELGLSPTSRASLGKSIDNSRNNGGGRDDITIAEFIATRPSSLSTRS